MFTARPFIFVMTCLAVAASISGRCDNYRSVYFENATDNRIEVYEEGRFSFALDPRETLRAIVTKEVWRDGSIRVVVPETGEVLLDDKISWQRLKELRFRIVIKDPKDL